MTEAAGLGGGPAAGDRALRTVMLVAFLGLVVTNLHPLGGKLYLQFLALVALVGAYAMGSFLSLRLWRVSAGQAAAFAVVCFGFFLSAAVRGVSVQSAETMLKYFLALAAFPVMAAWFGGMSDAARNRSIVFYAVLVALFVLATEWSRILGRTKPELTFLGGYNGANLHFLALTIYFLSQALFSPRGWRRKAGLAGGAVFLALMAATQSRQSILLAAFAIAYLYLAMRRLRAQRGERGGKGSLALLLVLGGFGGLALLAGVIDRFVFEYQAFGEDAPISSVERYLMMVQFWDELTPGKLFLGFGYDAVVRKLEGTTDSIHNGYLQLVFNGGLILFAGFCACFWISARRASRPWSPRRLFLLIFAAACMFDAHLISFQVLWLPGLVAALFPEEFPGMGPPAVLGGGSSTAGAARPGPAG